MPPTTRRYYSPGHTCYQYNSQSNDSKYFGSKQALAQEQQQIRKEMSFLPNSLSLRSFCSSFQHLTGKSQQKTIGHYIYCQKKDKIGRGYSSFVYKARSTEDKNLYAIKVINLEKMSKIHRQMLTNEIEILKNVQHPNVIKCYDIYQSQKNCYIITELCQGGDLQQKIKKEKYLSAQRSLEIIMDISEGLKYLHSKGIIHRDLKPANILKGKGGWKIVDFGFGIWQNTQIRCKTNVGTPLYMALESLINNKYSPQSDIFSLGVIWYQMLVGRTPWQSKSQKQLIQKMSKNKITFPQYILKKQQVTTSMQRIIQKMCSVRHSDRLDKVSFQKTDLTNLNQSSTESVKNPENSKGKNSLSISKNKDAQNTLHGLKRHKSVENLYQNSKIEISSLKIQKQNTSSKSKLPNSFLSCLDIPPQIVTEFEQKDQKDQIIMSPLLNVDKPLKRNVSPQAKGIGITKKLHYEKPLCLRSNIFTPTLNQSPQLSQLIEQRQNILTKRVKDSICTSTLNVYDSSSQSTNDIAKKSLKQLKDIRYQTAKQARLWQQNAHILVHQMHFCRFLYYIYKNDEYIPLSTITSRKLSQLVLKYAIMMLNEIIYLNSQDIGNPFNFSEIQEFVKSYQYLKIKETASEYKNRYSDEYCTLIMSKSSYSKKKYVSIMANISKTVSAVFLQDLQIQLEKISEQSKQHLSAMFRILKQQPKDKAKKVTQHSIGFVKANVEGYNNIIQFQRLVSLWIKCQNNYALFQRQANIVINTNYLLKQQLK